MKYALLNFILVVHVIVIPYWAGKYRWFNIIGREVEVFFSASAISFIIHTITHNGMTTPDMGMLLYICGAMTYMARLGNKYSSK